MEGFKGETGSVLMEFMVVLPIYMLLIGFAFVAGELSLQSLHLAGSADRTLAYEPTAFEKFKLAASPNRDDYDAGKESLLKYSNDPTVGSVTKKASEYDAVRIDQAAKKSLDSGFLGPWTKAVAAYVRDDYTLTPVTRGFIGFWYRQKFKMTTAPQSASGNKAAVLDEMLNNGVERSGMVGKDLSSSNGGGERPFGYYSLKRNEYGRNGYRKWSADNLASGDIWKSGVYDEALASAAYDDCPERNGSGNLGNKPGLKPPAIAAYARDDDFVDWSN